MNAMRRAITLHWPEYLCEAAGLGLFMVSACAAGLVLYHPASPVSAAIRGDLARRALMGLAMGLTAIGLVYSPWGRRSGAHLNPAVTLSFWRLDKVAGWDATFYAIAQVAGGAAGILIAGVASGGLVADPALNYLPTLPGTPGVTVAFVAEPEVRDTEPGPDHGAETIVRIAAQVHRGDLLELEHGRVERERAIEVRHRDADRSDPGDERLDRTGGRRRDGRARCREREHRQKHECRDAATISHGDSPHFR